MSKDSQIISYLSPADMVALMSQTGIVTVHETGMSDGKPVIHAALKVVNAQTGDHLPGGLPFSVVMFKAPNEPGYSNIAIGTIVPAAELNVALPRDYFNFCNQRFRFMRAFPVDERSFVIQMDLMVRNATREYVKFSFGLWGALFSQMLFELMGRGRESLIAAAEAYAAVHTDFSQQIAPVSAAAAADAVMPLQADAIVVNEAVAEAREFSPEAAKPAEEYSPADLLTDDPVRASWYIRANSDPAEGKDDAVDLSTGPELSIAAGRSTAVIAAADTVDLENAETTAETQISGQAEPEDVMPGY